MAELLPDYLEVGEGKPVLLIPGMEGAKEFWSFQLYPFGKRYRTLACGHVRRRPDLSRTMGDYAGDYLRLMDTLGVEKAAIIGESFGGLISQELAVSHPDRVAALVLCNTMDRPRPMATGLNMFTVASLAHSLTFSLPVPLRKPLLRWVGKHHGFVMDATAGNEHLADYILAHGMDPGMGGYLDKLIAGSRAQYSERLGQIRAPTLIFRGAEDRVVRHRTLAEMAARIPGAQFETVHAGGHCCQHTLPGPTNKILLGWLDRVGY